MKKRAGGFLYVVLLYLKCGKALFLCTPKASSLLGCSRWRPCRGIVLVASVEPILFVSYGHRL